MTDLAELTNLDCELLNTYQHDFPLVPNPYACIAEQLGVSEGEVLNSLERLKEMGAISRIGAVVTPHRAGWSTLGALKIPVDDFDEIAHMVSQFKEVNHNYERDHAYNLWFVVTAPNVEAVEGVLSDIQSMTGLTPLNLPLEQAYHIDLGFALKWH